MHDYPTKSEPSVSCGTWRKILQSRGSGMRKSHAHDIRSRDIPMPDFPTGLRAIVEYRWRAIASPRTGVLRRRKR
jgi:hypothetical protein